MNKKWIFVGGLVFAGCTKSEPIVQAVVKMPGDQIQINIAQNLQVADAQEKDFPILLDLNGKITIPDKNLFSISSRVSGRIETMAVSLGDSVKKGQTLATIWSADFVTTAEEYTMAKKEGGDLLRLTEQKLRALGLDPSEAQPGKTVFSFRSPIDGVVLEKKVNSGAAVNPGDVLLTVGKVGLLQFVGELAPDSAVKVKAGMKVIFDDRPMDAEIDSVSSISDPLSHLVKVRVKLIGTLPTDVPQESFLKAHVVLSHEKSIVVPTKSLILRDDGEYIFASVGDDAKIFKRLKVDVKGKTAAEMSVASTDFPKRSFKVIGDGAVLVNNVLDGVSEDN